MDRQQTIHDYMASQPVVKAWIFGSFARGEEKAKSDIDILFVPDFDKGHFTLLTHGGMYEDLKQLLGREVDLVADGSLRPTHARVPNMTKYWYMRELAKDKKYLKDIDWDNYLDPKSR